MLEEIWWCTRESKILIFTRKMSSMNTWNKTLAKETAVAATRRNYTKKLFKKIIKCDMKAPSQDSIV